MKYAIIGAIAKDEDPFLREWVQYHFLIGFEHIVIYDNNSKNLISKTLKEYVDAHLVTVIDFPYQESQQLSAYYHCIKTWKTKTRWLAFIDIDEFILPLVDNDIRDFLDRYTDYPGIALHWMTFSSNGHLKRPKEGVLKSYTASLGLQETIKSIVQPRFVTKPLSPHHFAYSHGLCVNEEKIAVPDHASYPVGNMIRINHYYYRSQQDFEEKIVRGLATKIKNLDSLTLDLFYAHLNEETRHDSAVSRFFPLFNIFSHKHDIDFIKHIKNRDTLNVVDGLKKIDHLIQTNSLSLAQKAYIQLVRYVDCVEVYLIGMSLYNLLEDMDQVKRIFTKGLQQFPDAKKRFVLPTFIYLSKYESSKHTISAIFY